MDNKRITALMAAVLGKEVVDENYKKKRIYIAFHPLEEKFETLTLPLKKSTEWISDISEFWKQIVKWHFWENILRKNQNMSDEDKNKVEKNSWEIIFYKTKDVGIVELDAKLDIEDVTEIL